MSVPRVESVEVVFMVTVKLTPTWGESVEEVRDREVAASAGRGRIMNNELRIKAKKNFFMGRYRGSNTGLQFRRHIDWGR